MLRCWIQETIGQSGYLCKSKGANIFFYQIVSQLSWCHLYSQLFSTWLEMVCCASLIILKMYVCALTKNFFNKHLKIVTIFSWTDVICTLNYLLGGGRVWCMASPCAVVVTGFVQKLKIICQPLPNYTTNHPTTRPPYKIFPEKNRHCHLVCNYNTHSQQYDHWPCTLYTKP